ncbi:MAG: hypothetical protein WBA67_08925 [Jannaschia sp.]
MDYGNDSLFTLSAGQIAGVLAISLGLSLPMLGLLRRVRFRGPAVRIGVAALLFAGFVWLSPQVYYLFYWATFEGLPLQIVVKAPPSPRHLARLLTFTDETSLSRHGQGVLGWSLFLLAARSPGAGVKP